jgi:glycosyltransferase involved in cell wall biosynthesis
VVTIHDAASAVHPEMFGPGQRWLYNPLYGWSARHATRVITNTEASKADIVRCWRAHPHRIVGIPLAPADYFTPETRDEARAETRRRFSPEGDPYFLFVGTMSGRRNVPLLIEAFALVHQTLPRHRLVLVTRNPHNVDLAASLRRLGLEAFVASPGYVAHAALAPLYAAAEALVIPAIYETTSLPAIEAQAAGAPVVCIDSDGMREVTGGVSSRFVRLEPDLVADAMLRVARDRTWHRQLSEAGVRNAGQVTWAKAATATLGVLMDSAR